MNIEQILTDYRIHFVTAGKNTALGNISVKCPWCGNADRSEHLGINLQTGEYHCWRNSNHSGRFFAQLLARLIPCSLKDAYDIVGIGARPVETATLPLIINQKFSQRESEPTERVFFPPQFRPITPTGTGFRFCSYLKERKFDVDWVVNHYKLHYAVMGRYALRVIIPFIKHNFLVGWTARAVGKAAVRYLSYPKGRAIKTTLLDYEYVQQGGEMLFVVEGPFDAMKVSQLFPHSRAVPILGTTCTQEQIALLAALQKRFRQICILLDADATSQSLHLQRQLAFLNPRTLQLPSNIKDPGELDLNKIQANSRLSDLLRVSRSCRFNPPLIKIPPKNSEKELFP